MNLKLLFAAALLALTIYEIRQPAGCTHIESLTPSTLPDGRRRYKVDARSNARVCYVIVDGVRVPMHATGNGLFEAEVYLHDKSVIWFESVVVTPKQTIRVVPHVIR